MELLPVLPNDTSWEDFRFQQEVLSPIRQILHRARAAFAEKYKTLFPDALKEEIRFAYVSNCERVLDKIMDEEWL
ncbi:hypothetical protein LCGC14_1155900 [marine sediment metagenome]|uniref:Uncharacterized protein n=1 Tax=marine sediment metagenome TaxID=412755 RepID=A0A0F9PCA5_9ZZZZ